MKIGFYLLFALLIVLESRVVNSGPCGVPDEYEKQSHMTQILIKDIDKEIVNCKRKISEKKKQLQRTQENREKEESKILIKRKNEIIILMEEVKILNFDPRFQNVVAIYSRMYNMCEKALINNFLSPLCVKHCLSFNSEYKRTGGKISVLGFRGTNPQFDPVRIIKDSCTTPEISKINDLFSIYEKAKETYKFIANPPLKLMKEYYMIFSEYLSKFTDCKVEPAQRGQLNSVAPMVLPPAIHDDV